MFRKVTLGLIAAASLGAAALAPSAASAHSWHVGGWHGGWGGYGHHAFYGGPTFYVGGLTDGCLQRRVGGNPPWAARPDRQRLRLLITSRYGKPGRPTAGLFAAVLRYCSASVAHR